jgi:hypothetical protein
MSSESVYQVARSWVDVGSFYTRFVSFKIFTASVRNVLDTPWCINVSASDAFRAVAPTHEFGKWVGIAQPV